MQTESMHNDIGMPLEQGQPRGHGGGRLCPYCKTREIQETCQGPYSPKTCGDGLCAKKHKAKCRKIWAEKNKERMRYLRDRLQPLWAADNMKKGSRIIQKAFQPNLLYPLTGP